MNEYLTIKSLTEIVAEQSRQIHELQTELHQLQKLLRLLDPEIPPKKYPWDPPFEVHCYDKY
jgi:uncharacterized coiled-coil protein SlyX